MCDKLPCDALAQIQLDTLTNIVHSQIFAGPFHAVWTNGPLRCRIRALFRQYSARPDYSLYSRAVIRTYGTRADTYIPWIHNMRMRRAGWVHMAGGNIKTLNDRNRNKDEYQRDDLKGNNITVFKYATHLVYMKYVHTAFLKTYHSDDRTE